jgi:hypothetical protein
MVGQLTASGLDAILTILCAHGVVSAELTAAGDLRVVFAPSNMPPPPGDETTPGGWKGPAHLDRDVMDDERSVP